MIANLQATRREFLVLEASYCATEVKFKTLESMEACIEAVLALMAGEPEEVVHQKLVIAKEKINESGDALDRLLKQGNY